MTLPWKTWTRSLLPSTTRTWTFTSSPGAKSGMSSRSDSLSIRSVAFIAPSWEKGSRRIRDGRELFQQRDLVGAESAPGLDQIRPGDERPVQRLGVTPAGDPSVVAAPQHLGHR